MSAAAWKQCATTAHRVKRTCDEIPILVIGTVYGSCCSGPRCQQSPLCVTSLSALSHRTFTYPVCAEFAGAAGVYLFFNATRDCSAALARLCAHFPRATCT